MQALEEFVNSVYSLDNFIVALKLSFAVVFLYFCCIFLFSFIRDAFCSVCEWFDDLKKSIKENKSNKVNLDK